MAKAASDTPSASAEKALSRRKKRARREAKLMLAIEKAQKDLKQAQAQARLEERSTALQTLEAKLEELRTPTPVPASETPPPSAELESQQEPSELESSIVRSDGQQSTSPDQQYHGEIPSLTDQIIASPHVEEDMVVTNEVTIGPEAAAVQDNGTTTATEPAPTQTTSRKAPAQKTTATRKPTATKRPTSPATTIKRSASRSQSTVPGSHTQMPRKKEPFLWK